MNAVNPQHWVDDYGDSLFAYAFAQIRDRGIAQDLVQDTLLTALKSLNAFEGRSTEKTWITGILKNKIRDHIRAKYRGMNKLIESGESPDSFFDEAGHWKIPLAPGAPTPLEEMENREFQKKFADCFAKLKEFQRDVFNLRIQQDIETDECCKILGLTPTHLGVILYRTRHQLRRCLEIHWLALHGGKA